MSQSWFLLQLKPNAHRKAISNLSRQGFECFLPMQEVTTRRASGFANVQKPLFPGYMFVRFDPASAPWRKINSTYGVAKLISFTGTPTPLPDALITGLMARCDDAGKLRPMSELQSGDEVELLTGPFADFIATVDSIDANRRVWVLMEMMGQTTRLSLDPDQVRLRA